MQAKKENKVSKIIDEIGTQKTSNQRYLNQKLKNSKTNH